MVGTAAVAAAGAVGTYLYMKPKLRKNLKNSKSPKEAMNLVGHELEHDALTVAGKAMDMGSAGLHKISKSLSSRPVAMRSAPRRHIARKAPARKKAVAPASSHSSSK